MEKHERIQAALNLEEVDRVPINLWMHHSDVDNSPLDLAETQINMAKKYDFDFIKLMPFGLYSVEDWGARVQYFSKTNHPPKVKHPGINTVEDWGRLEVLPAIYGTYGKQLQLAQYVSRKVGGEIPFIQTIFSPLTTAKKLAGDRLLLDMITAPELVKKGLEVITETTINFVKANIEAGVDGFFFATQLASKDILSEEEYEIFGEFYDLKVINSFNSQTDFNVVHMHGDNIMFDLVKDYPIKCLNWHDRWTSPSLAEARQVTNKCLMGGVREKPFYNSEKVLLDSPLLNGTAKEVENHVKESVDAVAGKGLIISPGCVIDQATPEMNIYAARRAIERGSIRV